MCWQLTARYTGSMSRAENTIEYAMTSNNITLLYSRRQWSAARQIMVWQCTFPGLLRLEPLLPILGFPDALKHHCIIKLKSFVHITNKHPLLITTKRDNPDSKVHGANMGPTWVLSAPDGPYVGPMNLALRDGIRLIAAGYWTSNPIEMSYVTSGTHTNVHIN